MQCSYVYYSYHSVSQNGSALQSAPAKWLGRASSKHKPDAPPPTQLSHVMHCNGEGRYVAVLEVFMDSSSG